MRSALALTFACILFVFNANSQIITGKVSDDSFPLVGATVMVKATKQETFTDSTGHFKIKVDTSGKVLIFSYVGYERQEVGIEGKKVVNVRLKRGANTLDEVVVIGYGTVKRKDMAGIDASISRSASSESHYSSSDIRVRGSASEAIDGKLAGVNIGTEGKDVSKSTPRRLEVPGAKNIAGMQEYSAGILTAGEINDFGKWKLWNDKSQEELRQHRIDWLICPSMRFSVLVQNKDGIAMVGQAVYLLDNQHDTVWQARTDNVGKAELWANMFDERYTDENTFSIAANCEGKVYTIRKAKKFHDGINLLTVRKGCDVSDIVDVAFVVDATGSMGDEINYLKVELRDVIAKVKEANKGLSLRLGSVFYRDRDQGDEYITRKSEMSEDISKIIDFINLQTASGGGDYPEAVDDGLDVAINELKWSDSARTKIIFLILDAPPHQRPAVLAKMQRLTAEAAAMGIRIVPITGSGTDKSTEYLMRSLALCTNGTYVFLTDNSGVGEHHIAPTTDRYDVEKLNAILMRVFKQYTSVVTCKKELPEDAIAGVSDTTRIEGLIKTASEETGEVRNPQKEFNCALFPNPTSGILNIRIEGNINEMFLSDIAGRILERFMVNGKSHLQINISQYPTGIYLMSYYGDNNVPISAKIILNR